MTIYFVGCLIAFGFFIGTYWPDDEFWERCRNSDNLAHLMAVTVTLLVTLFSWVSVVAMIANKAYHADKKNWNV